MSSTEKLRQKEEELEILHRVAGYISSALSLEELLEKTVDTAVSLTGADSCLIYLLDEEAGELVLKASKNPHPEVLDKIKLKMGEGLTGWAAKKMEPLAISSEAYSDPRFRGFAELPEDAYEAFLSVPVISGDELVGVINLQNRKEHEYPEYQVNLLFTLAQYLGSAVKNAAAILEIREKARQLELLSQISGTIISDGYINEILQLIATMAAQVLKSKICSIMLLDERKQELVIAATQSLSSAYRDKPPIKVGQSVSGRAVLEKRVITVDDVTADRDYMYPGIARSENIVSMLAVPMMVKERVIGVINSYTDKLREFSQEEINILRAIANQAAAAIENTRLSEEVIKAREELETRKLIEKAKGVLMKDLGISEDEAYRKLRKKSMDLRKSMRDLAEAVVLAADVER